MTTTARPAYRPGQAPAAAAPARKKTMTLDAVTRGAGREPDRVFLYGVEKIGKSTFAASAPDVVFISSENGLAEIRPAPARFPEVRTFADVLDAIDTLATETHGYKTLAVDSLDWIAAFVNEECRERNRMSAEKFDAYGRGYKLALEDWRKFILALERLQSARGMEVILIAHAEAKTVDPPDGAPYTRYQPKMGGGSIAAALVKEWAKSVLFARHEYFVTGGSEFAKAKGVSTGKRVIHTQWTAAWDAGSRYALPAVLPLDYAAYAEARDGGMQESAAELRAQAVAALEAWAPAADIRVKVEATIAGCGEDVSKLRRVVDTVRTRMDEAKRGETPQEGA